MPKYPDEAIAEIKSRVRLSDLIGRTVKLKRVGKDYRGLSPFSNEKTPSFYVHDDRGFYKCFSTQKAGDCITFLMETQRMSFAEAVEHLAEIAGVKLTAPTEEQSAAAAERTRILAALQWAQDYFARQLFWNDTPAGKAARVYVGGRGFKNNSDLTAAGIGWAPNADLRTVKDAPGVETLIAAGLWRQRTDGSEGPMFRNRITLPIHNTQGRVIGFTARALQEGQQPKYLNTPDTAVFTKGEALFGFHEARKRLAKVADLFCVEGCFDVTSMARAGYAACAPLGTALTRHQLEMLWRAVESPILCFDGDAAGLRAARRSAETALPLLRAGRSLRFIVLPQGQDPDSILQGRPDGRTAFTHTVSHFDVVWDLLAEGLDLVNPDDRGRFKRRAKDVLVTIDDRNVAKEWRLAMTNRFGGERQAPPRAPAGPTRDQRQALTREAKRELRTRLQEPELTAAILLAAVIDSPDRVQVHFETLAGMPCGKFQPLRDWLLEREDSEAGLLHPWAADLIAELRAMGSAAIVYSAKGWERAARAFIARYGTP